MIKASKTHGWLTAALCSAAGCLLLVFSANIRAQDAERVVVQDSASIPKQRLHIDYGITEANYRQQVLALTPLGSTYEQVKAFAFSEWQAEKRRLYPAILKGVSREVRQEPLVSYGKSFKTFFVGDYRKLLSEQPPHIKISDPTAPFTAQQGKGYIIPFFYNRPVWWKRELYVSVIYIFDDRSKLIDAFAHSDIVRPPSW